MIQQLTIDTIPCTTAIAVMNREFTMIIRYNKENVQMIVIHNFGVVFNGRCLVRTSHLIRDTATRKPIFGILIQKINPFTFWVIR